MQKMVLVSLWLTICFVSSAFAHKNDFQYCPTPKNLFAFIKVNHLPKLFGGTMACLYQVNQTLCVCTAHGDFIPQQQNWFPPVTPQVLDRHCPLNPSRDAKVADCPFIGGQATFTCSIQGQGQEPCWKS